MEENLNLYVLKNRHVFVALEPLVEGQSSFVYFVGIHPSVEGAKRRGRPPGKLLSNGLRRQSLALEEVEVCETTADLSTAANKILQLVRDSETKAA